MTTTTPTDLDDDGTSEQDIANYLQEALNDAAADADDEPGHVLHGARIDDLRDYLTTDKGVEIQLPNGDTYLITVKYNGRR